MITMLKCNCRRYSYVVDVGHMEVNSRDEAVELIEGDPYLRLGLRRGYRLFVWGKAPCYQTVAL
jgi:hypothetical protein